MRFANFACGVFTILILQGPAVLADAVDCSAVLSNASVRIEFSKGLRFNSVSRKINPRYLRELLRINNFEPLPLGPKRAWMIVFEHDARLFDRGYVLKGYRDGGRFVIDEVHPAHHGDEGRYFRNLAESKAILQRTLTLRSDALTHCREIFVRAATMVKLWLKHQLKIEDVLQLLDSPTTAAARDTMQTREFGDRHHYRGVGRDGRRLRAIIEEQPGCYQTLVTAFEEP